MILPVVSSNTNPILDISGDIVNIPFSITLYSGIIGSISSSIANVYSFLLYLNVIGPSGIHFVKSLPDNDNTEFNFSHFLVV